jgi:hypothetical protein
MRLVFLESPFAGITAKNVAYARAAMRHSLDQGEAPFASHLLYPQSGILDNELPPERQRGLTAGWAWLARAEVVAVYDDLGVTAGMQAGIDRATAAGIPIEYRKVPDWTWVVE